MAGFKSFVEKITLSFDPGVTAIVGPNGCGKSNVADAIRWTLGEQNPRLLRGERMDEMIFAGSIRRKPIGAAEVSLLISEVQGCLPTPFSDVQMTRRLYRSGESEYLLNGAPCRLKDITDLFLDTALGRAMPYALIEQGAIGSIVDSHPADRRALIEEAAGIMNYKLKRRAALAKLETTAQNLLRVQDILAELERQRGSLQRQARKAERYQALSDQFTRARLALRSLEYREALEALGAAATARRTAEERLEGCRARAAALDASLAEARLGDAERERDLTAAQEALYRLRNALERQESALRGEMARVDDQRRHRAEAEAAHRQIAARLEALRGEQVAVSRALDEALRAVDGEAAALAAQTREVQALEARIADTKDRVGEDRARAVRHAAAAIERRNALTQLEVRARLVQAQADKSRGRLDESRALRQAAQAEIRRRLEAHGEADARVRTLRDRRDAIAAEVQGLERHLADLRARLAACREEGAAARSRCRSLEEVEANFEGFDEGHRFLLQRKAAGEGAARGLRGPVAEGLEVSARHERAIEALLGPDLQGIVVEDVEAARAALRLLTTEARGRATLIPAAGLRGNGPGLPDGQASLARARAELPGLNGDSPIEGLAVDLVASRNGDRGLIERLFAGALVVRDLDAALALWDRLPAPSVIATLDGDLLTPRGTITGGPALGASPFARRRELEAIREQGRALEAEEARLAADLRATESLLATRRGAAEAVEAEARAAEAARGRLEGDVSAAHAEGLRTGRQLDLFTQEVETAEAELAEIAEARRIAAEAVERLDAEALALEASRAALEASLDALVQQRDQAQAQVAEGRLRLAGAEAARDARRQELERATADLARAEAEAEGLAQALARAAGEIAALERRIEALRATAVAVAADERAADASSRRAHERRAESQAAIQDLEAALKPARQALAEAEAEWTQLEVRHAELAKAVSLVAEQVQEEHGLAAEALLAQFAGEPIDAAARREEVDALRAKLADMGPVNLGAIEEFQAVEDRYTFLTGQAADLRESVASLRKAIAEINRTIVGLFETTLAGVNQHFTAFWERLFGGGSAALVLLEPGEPAAEGSPEGGPEPDEEPGLEMLLRFPGKRPGNLSLLSGGEKALAALALLLALFKVKPTPFCLLDEVDAPLDEPNTERFVALLRELSRDTQIIVITHNKKTMESADALYGITMEEEGVSKLISIRLRDLEAQAAQESQAA